MYNINFQSVENTVFLLMTFLYLYWRKSIIGSSAENKISDFDLSTHIPKLQYIPSCPASKHPEFSSNWQEFQIFTNFIKLFKNKFMMCPMFTSHTVVLPVTTISATHHIPSWMCCYSRGSLNLWSRYSISIQNLSTFKLPGKTPTQEIKLKCVVTDTPHSPFMPNYGQFTVLQDPLSS
jgi:hypothetical protein